MATQGGNWKDLVKAAGNGDLRAVRYHLQQGVDPNFQHPEYFTAPIFEAIRNNHLEVIELLVEGKYMDQGEIKKVEGITMANPQLVEEETDLSAVELALEEGKHDIVDYLNTQLPPDAQSKPKHVLVTGGNRGIGKAIVEQLLRQGHVVAFTCRDADAGAQVVRELIEKTGNKKLQVVIGDLSSIAKVRTLGKTILTEFPKLQVLIHNAGIWPTECELNDDGLELSFMVNYMAPLILTETLLPQLQGNGPAASDDVRVVLVTAGLAIFGKADPTKTPLGKDFSRFKTYMHTKQCGMIWCLHQARLQEKLSPTGRATFVAVHPGVINTGFGATGGCMGCILRCVKKTWKTPEEGAAAPVWLAVSPEAKSAQIHGKFYHEMDPYELKGDATCMLDPKVQEEWAQWTKDFLARPSR